MFVNACSVLFMNVILTVIRASSDDIGHQTPVLSVYDVQSFGVMGIRVFSEVNLLYVGLEVLDAGFVGHRLRGVSKACCTATVDDLAEHVRRVSGRIGTSTL